jgi:hypothetical protein
MRPADRIYRNEPPIAARIRSFDVEIKQENRAAGMA